MDEMVIHKQIDLSAPLSRVWRALTDATEFGRWFGVKLEGPFQVGQAVRGRIQHPEYAHLIWEARVEKIEPERLFAFRWHPYAVNADRDYSAEERTLVEFRLEPTPEGTRLYLTESGFAGVPADRRAEAWRMNSQGWAIQMGNIAKHVG